MPMNRYDFNEDYAHEFKEKVEARLEKSWWQMLIVAIVMIVIGVLCFVFPSDTFSVVLVIAGILLIVQGIMQIVMFYRMPVFMRDPLAILNGLFSILTAILLISMPTVVSAAAFGFIFAFMLLSSGFEKLGLGWRMNFYDAEKKHTALTVSAVLDIVLGILFFIMPITGLLAVGYLIAAYLVVAGIALVIESVSFKVKNK